jgi:L-fuculose-phosphate aldolase
MTPSSDEAIRTNIIDKCRLLEKIGYFIGTWGNISARVPGGLIVTPTRLAYDLMTPDDLVTLASDGRVLSSKRLPTSEAEIHRAVMNKREDVGAIIHSHPPYATAVSCLHLPIPPFVEEVSQIVGGQINCTRYVPAGQHRKIAEESANTIGGVNAVLLANHGLLCCGRDLDEVFVTTQVVEKAAMMMLAAGHTGKLQVIPEEFVQSERHRFLYKYGTSGDAP